MSEPGRSVAPPVAVGFAVVGFFALLIAGFGLVSLYSGADILAVPGLGQVPGVVGTGLATLAFGGIMWIAAHRRRPSYASAGVAAVAAFLAYLLGLLVGAVLAGTDAGLALAAIGGFATSWFAVVLAAAALVAGWACIALVRTRAARPRWPWEHDDEP
ncbi:hypothetical protein [Microbacterium sp.]|uniref:hypothetical protein n=1 Tax=Microbacterium sp. TaxID=51671 RepID=UPI0039E39314